MRKGKNRYVVEVNDWGCGLMIKDTQTGREIDAPDDEVITLCIKEMNSLAKELDTVRSVAEDNKRECEATRIENARLKADAERYRLASLRVDVGELHAQFNRALFNQTIAENTRLQAQVERLTNAGDELERVLTSKMSSYEAGNASFQWRAAKEGKQS